MNTPYSTCSATVRNRFGRLALGLVLTTATFAAGAAGETPALTIANAVLVSWPVSDAESYVVVGADAVEGPYVPLLEPVISRPNEKGVAVPATGKQQFYQLKPGFQLFDDGSGASGDWQYWTWPLDHKGGTLTHTNGALRIQIGPSGPENIYFYPPGAPGASSPPPVTEPHRDFALSIDLLNWNGLTANFGLLARMTWPPAMMSGGGLEGKGSGTPLLFSYLNWGADTWLEKSVLCPMVRGRSYRVICTGVGDQLTTQVFELGSTNKLVSSVQMADPKNPSGPAASLFLGYAWPSATITVANYRLTAVRP